MTRAQQTQVLARLRELEATLADVVFARDEKGNYVDDRRSPPYVIGKCRSLVDGALSAAGAEGRA